MFYRAVHPGLLVSWLARWLTRCWVTWWTCCCGCSVRSHAARLN